MRAPGRATITLMPARAHFSVCPLQTIWRASSSPTLTWQTCKCVSGTSSQDKTSLTTNFWETSSRWFHTFWAPRSLWLTFFSQLFWWAHPCPIVLTIYMITNISLIIRFHSRQIFPTLLSIWNLYCYGYPSNACATTSLYPRYLRWYTGVH